MTAILTSAATQAIVALVASPAVAVPQANRLANTPYVLLAAIQYGERQERFIVNPNAAGSIWVTFFDGVVPGANVEGCFEIPAGGAWSGSVTNEVRGVFTAAAMAITAGTR